MTKKKYQKQGGGMIKVIVALVMALVLGAGVCCMGYASRDDGGKWFGNFKNISEWHWADPKPDEGEPWQTVAVSEDGEAMLAGVKYDMPAAFAFLTAESDEQIISDYGITVSVALSNEYINGLYEWSWAFENTSSEWVQGKNAQDYLNITANNNFSDAVNIKALQPFGEPIIVKATLVNYEETFATCKIDYIQRVTDMTNEDMGSSDFSDPVNFGFDLSYGIGTVKGTVTLTSARINIKPDFITDFKSYLRFDVSVKDYNFTNIKIDEYRANKFSWDGDTLEYSMFIKDFDSFSSAQKDAIYYAWFLAYGNNDYSGAKGNVTIDLNVEYTYNGRTISTVAESDVSGLRITGDCYGSGLDASVLMTGGNTAL